MLNNFISQQSHESGLTLVEIIVSVAIFAIVAFVASAALVSIVGEAQRSRSAQTAVNNLNVAVDDMVRSLRTGFYFDCAYSNPYFRGPNTDCTRAETNRNPVAYTSITFVNSSRDVVQYFWHRPTQSIVKMINPNCTASNCDDHVDTNQRNDSLASIRDSFTYQSSDDPIDLYPITSPDISIEDFFITVAGTRDSNLQSTVQINMRGTAGDPATATSSFSIQTSATKRLLYP